MNRSIIALGLIFGLLFSVQPTLAANEIVGPSASFQDKVNAQRELQGAIRLRQINYLLELKRGHEGHAEQFANHQYNLFRNNVSTQATFVDRDGELEDVPDYPFRRPSTNASIEAPNNAKRNFRVRAIDYYVEAGDAGAEVLTNNVKLGSEHQVKREYLNKQMGGQAGYADMISSIRQLQRSNYAKSESTNFVPFSQRTGSTGRNYLHPFMKFLE